jgi:ABC-type transport system involved in cytochrome c biogenesis permease component
MMLLPIVDRELRVASRRATTYWLRFSLVLVGSVLWFLLLTMLPSGLPLQRGKMVFVAVATLAFAFCLLAGVFLTSDCLSQEKREGTVGLLFLTELKGYDVVLGKLLATSLHAIYGLLAVFPLLGLAMLVGGVTAGEFWRITLVLLVTLFCSLSAGMLVSAVSRETREAMSLCLLVIAILAGVPLLLSFGARLAFVHYRLTASLFLWPSPIAAYRSAFDGQFSSPQGSLAFWGALLTISLLSAITLALACHSLPQRWAERSQPVRMRRYRDLWLRLRLAPCGGFARRSVGLDANPFFWLTTRDPRPRLLAWALLGGLFVPWFGLLAGSFSSSAAVSRFCFCAALFLAYAMHQGLKWLVASEASRRFSEDRSSGALELLLVSPLSVRQIITGQRQSLRSLFFFPKLFTLGINAVLFWFLGWANHPAITSSESVIYGELCICGALLLLADFYALGWVGMRMAFQTSRHQRAILATLARVLLLPWLAILFLGLLVMGGAGLSFELVRVLTVLWSGLAAVLVLSAGARAKGELLEGFRQFSSQTKDTVPMHARPEDPTTAFAKPAFQQAD